MNFSLIYDWALQFYADYPIFCYIAAAVLLLLLLWKPAKILKSLILIVIVLAVLSAVFYLIDSMKVGVHIKQEGMQKTGKSLE